MSGQDRQEGTEHELSGGRLSNIPVVLGVYLLSDNMTLRESWRSVNDD